MVAFVTTDIPSSVNSVEKLAVWCATILNHNFKSQTAIEATGSAQRTATAAPFEITAVDPPVWRHISRLSIGLDPNWVRGGKIWNFAQDLGSAAIPTEFKS